VIEWFLDESDGSTMRPSTPNEFGGTSCINEIITTKIYSASHGIQSYLGIYLQAACLDFCFIFISHLFAVLISASLLLLISYHKGHDSIGLALE